MDEQLLTSYKHVRNSKNVILLVTTGSAILGMAQPNQSDIDEDGIYIERPEDLIGFKQQDTVTYRTATERTGVANAKSEAGDIDLTMFGLRKFLNLALAGNPNRTTMLYAPDSSCVVRTFIGEELQNLAPKIVSKRGIYAYLGYLQSQRDKFTGSRGGRGVNRPELEQAHGYDTKYAMHMARLGIQARQLLVDRKLSFPLGSWDVKLLNYIREGAYSYDDIIRIVNEKEDDIRRLLEVSGLQAEPDYDAVEKWMIGIYTNNWRQ